MSPSQFQSFEELDTRISDGIEITLLWSRADDAIRVAVNDGRTGEQFELSVEPRRALDAFRHPYAYLG